MQFHLKSVLLISALQFICGGVFSQTTNTEKVSEPTKPITVVAKNTSLEKAGFPGGKDSLAKYLSENTKYPKSVRKNKIEGVCLLTFTVTNFGNILDVKVARGVPNCTECDAEAIRVIKSMPLWIPANLDGERFDSVQVLSIAFKR